MGGKGSGIYKRQFLNDGDNTKILEFNLKVKKLSESKKIDRTTPNVCKVLQKRCDDYYELCGDYDVKPTIEGLALAVGVNRTTLQKWANNIYDWNQQVDTRSVLEKELSFLNSQMATYMMEGKINPVNGIFLMKNSYGYSDQTEHIITPDNSRMSTREQLIEEAKNLQIGMNNSSPF